MSALRPAVRADGAALLGIYAPYVESSAITFETEVPTVQAFSDRIEAIAARYPYLVYQAEGRVVGYAYACQHRERAAYRYDVDVSIYVAEPYHGAGVANTLYRALFAILVELGYVNAYAAYTLPNEKSRRFHEKHGFELIGVHRKTGYKLGRWHDVAWMDKRLAVNDGHPGDIRSIGEIPNERLIELLNGD